MAKSRTKRTRIPVLSYVFIGILVTGITVGVILVQEGTDLFSFAKTSFGTTVEPGGWFGTEDIPNISQVPSTNQVPITPPVTRSGRCGWCGTSCVSGEMLRRLRCADVDRNPNLSCRAMVEDEQTVCRVVNNNADSQ